RHLPPSKIAGTYLQNAIVADGCMVAAEHIVRSVVGIRSRIGPGVTMQDTYMMGADSYQTLTDIDALAKQGLPCMGIGANSHIERAILDKNCAIGENVRIVGGAHLENGDFGTYGIVDGVVVVKKWAVVPSGTVIGEPSERLVHIFLSRLLKSTNNLASQMSSPSRGVVG